MFCWELFLYWRIRAKGFSQDLWMRGETGKENNFMRDKPEDYTEEELTFYWSEEDYREFLDELKEYQP